MDIACPECAAPYEIDDASVTASGRKVRCASCSTVWRVYPALAASSIPLADAALAIDPDANPFATEPAEEILGDGGPRALNPVEAESETLAAQPEASTVEDTQAAVVALPDATGLEEAALPPPRARLAKDRKPIKNPAKGKKGFLVWKTAAIAATLAVFGVGIHQRETTVRLLPQTAGLFKTIGLPVNLRGIEITGVASRIIDDNGVQILVIDGDLHNISNRKVDLPRLRFAVRGNDGQEVYVWSAQADKNSLQPGETLNFRRRLAAPPTDGKDVSVRFLTRSDTTGGLR